MPARYTIDPDQKCIFVYLSGTIGDWEMGTEAQRLWRDELFDPLYARLFDGSEVTALNVNSSLLRAIAEDVRIRKSSSTALVAENEAVRASYLVYIESLQGVPARLFNHVNEAAAWLGVRLPDPWPPAVAGTQ